MKQLREYLDKIKRKYADKIKFSIEIWRNFNFFFIDLPRLLSLDPCPSSTPAFIDPRRGVVYYRGLVGDVSTFNSPPLTQICCTHPNNVHITILIHICSV